MLGYIDHQDDLESSKTSNLSDEECACGRAAPDYEPVPRFWPLAVLNRKAFWDDVCR